MAVSHSTPRAGRRSTWLGHDASPLQVTVWLQRATLHPCESEEPQQQSCIMPSAPSRLMAPQGTPWHPPGAPRYGSKHRQQPHAAPSTPAIPVFRTGQDPSLSLGGLARTRGTHSRTAASHLPEPGGFELHTSSSSTAKLAAAAQPTQGSPGRGAGGPTCRQPAWGR